MEQLPQAYVFPESFINAFAALRVLPDFAELRVLSDFAALHISCMRQSERDGSLTINMLYDIVNIMACVF